MASPLHSAPLGFVNLDARLDVKILQHPATAVYGNQHGKSEYQRRRTVGQHPTECCRALNETRPSTTATTSPSRYEDAAGVRSSIALH